MRIICLEEHVVDPDLAKASAPFAQQAAPYQRGLNTLYKDDPAASSENRPLLYRGFSQQAHATLRRRECVGRDGLIGDELQVLIFCRA